MAIRPLSCYNMDWTWLQLIEICYAWKSFRHKRTLKNADCQCSRLYRLPFLLSSPVKRSLRLHEFCTYKRTWWIRDYWKMYFSCRSFVKDCLKEIHIRFAHDWIQPKPSSLQSVHWLRAIWFHLNRWIIEDTALWFPSVRQGKRRSEQSHCR